jgi:hypothetical protein
MAQFEFSKPPAEIGRIPQCKPHPAKPGEAKPAAVKS